MKVIYIKGKVKWAKGHLETPQGPVGVDWKMEENSLSVKVDVPVNSTATLILPDNFRKINESGKTVWHKAKFNAMKGVNHIEEKEGKVAIELSAGCYQFSII